MVLPRPGSAGLTLLFCLAVGIAGAAPAPPAPPAEEPEPELLDFLGGWQNENGHGVDPFTINHEDTPQSPVKPKPNRSGTPPEVHKPAPETQSTSTQGRPRDPLRMQTGP